MKAASSSSVPTLLVAYLAFLAQDVQGFTAGGIGNRGTSNSLTKPAHASPINKVFSRSAGVVGRLRMGTEDEPRKAADEVGDKLDEKKPKKGVMKTIRTWWAESIPAPDAHGPSPAGISQESKPVQALSVAAIAAGFVFGTRSMLKLLADLETTCTSFASWKAAFAPVMGVFYLGAGALHFVKLKEMCNIVPPKGTWGLWYVPGRASLHVKWTGIAEVVAAAGLLAGWLGQGPPELARTAAGVLFALTVAVTPANVFMFTHGAQFPEGTKVPVIGHVARAVVQVLLLSVLWTLAAV